MLVTFDPSGGAILKTNMILWWAREHFGVSASTAACEVFISGFQKRCWLLWTRTQRSKVSTFRNVCRNQQYCVLWGDWRVRTHGIMCNSAHLWRHHQHRKVHHATYAAIFFQGRPSIFQQGNRCVFRLRLNKGFLFAAATGTFRLRTEQPQQRKTSAKRKSERVYGPFVVNRGGVTE